MEDLCRTKEERRKEIDEVGSRTDRLEHVQSDQTRAILELQTITQDDHQETKRRLQQLEDRIATVSTAMLSPKESPGTIEGIYCIPDQADIKQPLLSASNLEEHPLISHMQVTMIAYSHYMRAQPGVRTSRNIFSHPSCRASTIGRPTVDFNSWRIE